MSPILYFSQIRPSVLAVALSSVPLRLQRLVTSPTKPCTLFLAKETGEKWDIFAHTTASDFCIDYCSSQSLSS